MIALDPFRKYATFSGRARRREFWLWQLFLFSSAIVLAVLDALLRTDDGQFGNGLLGSIFQLAALIPGVAVTVRRLHDADRSAWWLLIIFLPIIGFIVLLVFLCRGGTIGNNRYGEDPKARTQSNELVEESKVSK